ncbi:MAG TPA: DUF2267 domain-containing protein [Candidatus Cybelea sp.]|nr:DUF2267 domain-containing protein [Candidatus Cybelea sp.]
MSSAGLDSVDRTVQDTNLWLKAIARGLGTENRKLAFEALRATLHALRDRIGPENAIHLGAQLPMLVRGLYYEGWRPSGTPTRERHLDEFVDHVASMLPARSELDPEAVGRVVFGVLAEHLDHGEIVKVMRMLPRQVRGLWPAGIMEGIAYLESQEL